jgi:regulator of sigma E protease
MISILQNIPAYLVAFGILVVVHEFGHYSVARLCGVKILRFSVGIGKVLISRRFGRDQTEWALSAFPLGGYVKMLDARDPDQFDIPEEDLKQEFTRQSVWKRIAIVAAGPAANFILAIAVFWGLAVYGDLEPIARLGQIVSHTQAADAGLQNGDLITAVNGKPIRSWNELRWSLAKLALGQGSANVQYQRNVAGTQSQSTGSAELSLNGLTAEDLDDDFSGKLGLVPWQSKPIVEDVDQNGPAALAGFQHGDVILAINGVSMANGLQFQNAVYAAAGKSLEMQIERNGQTLTLHVTPDTVKDEGRTHGLIRLKLSHRADMIVVRDTPGDALVKAVVGTWDMTILQLKMIGKMIIGQVSLKKLTGPITIADYAGQAAKAGPIIFVRLVAFISISLGVMNLLPIPVLDGGLLLYYSLEVLTGRPVSARFGEIAQRAGLGILMTLMIVAVFNDIARHMT